MDPRIIAATDWRDAGTPATVLLPKSLEPLQQIVFAAVEPPQHVRTWFQLGKQGSLHTQFRYLFGLEYTQ